jgi:hypothetical protein
LGRYRVMVDDNYHYQDLDERYEHGVFEDAEAALQACRRIVEASLSEQLEAGMTADELYGRYTMFGEDPFILTLEGDAVTFSAWDYARERCTTLTRPE